MQNVEGILSELGFTGIEDAAKKHAQLLISGKVAKYEAESIFYEKKYNCDYPAFEKHLKEKVNEENFDEEDDLLEWRFAYEQLTKYREQIVRLKR